MKLRKVEKIELIDGRRSLLSVWLSKLSSFAFLGICIYISRGSAWWTFFTATSFLLFLVIHVANFYETRWRKFNSLQELIDWAEEEKGNEDEH